MNKKMHEPVKRTPAWHLLASLVLILTVGLSACAVGATQTATMAETQEPAMMETQPATEMMDTAEDTGMQAEQMDDAGMQADSMNGATEEPMIESSAAPMMEASHDDMMESTAEPMVESSTAPVMAPDWLSVTLDNVNSGESFALQDLSGKVVLVETMAVWCTNCLQQQRQVKALHELLGERDDFVSLGLDIDPNENAADLKAFVDRNGFDWRYAVAPTEVARELGNLYGAQFLNPPSTPMLIVDRHGEVHPLPFGIKDAQTLKDALDPFLADQM